MINVDKDEYFLVNFCNFLQFGKSSLWIGWYLLWFAYICIQSNAVGFLFLFFSSFQVGYDFKGETHFVLWLHLSQPTWNFAKILFCFFFFQKKVV